MNILTTIKAMIRAATGKEEAQRKYLTMGTGYHPYGGGIAVTADTALRLAVVYRCVALLSGAIASLPLHIYQRRPDGTKERVKSHLDRIIGVEPFPGMSAATYWEYQLSASLLRGDHFAIIKRDPGSNRVNALQPVSPDKITVGFAKDGSGELIYGVTPRSGELKGYSQDDIIHVPGPGFDGLRSKSAITYAASSAISIALSADAQVSNNFNKGLSPRYAIAYPEDRSITPEQAEGLREAWEKTYGGPSNSHKPMVLNHGAKLHQLTLSAADAQLLETRQWQTTDIAMAHGVPLHMLGLSEKQSSWGTGIEQMNIGFVQYTLQAWFNRITSEYNRKLFSPGDKFMEFIAAGLLRGDSKARSDYYRQALGGSMGPGWMTQNEIRRFENLPPIPGGDLLTEFGTNEVTS